MAAQGPGRRPSAVTRAVEKQIRGLPKAVREDALAALARHLAREVDAGDRAGAGPLMRALKELRSLAAPAPGTAPAQEEPDELDELARARAARLAEAAGVVRTLGADERRPGGRAAR